MTIYLIRHAQSEFNAVYNPNLSDPMIFDAPLSKLGIRQAEQTRQKIDELNISKVIVSPLTRAIQTASILFDDSYPVEVNAVIREQLLNSCDIGRSAQHLGDKFPHLDFSHLAACWWHDKEKDERGISVEPESSLQQRADEFITYLKESKTRCTAIVSHGNFISAVTGIKPDNCEIVPFDLAGR